MTIPACREDENEISEVIESPLGAPRLISTVAGLLYAAGTTTLARRRLSDAGYWPAAHTDGWRLLGLCAGCDTALGPGSRRSPIGSPRDQLDVWCSQALRKYEAAVAWTHPALKDFLFRDLEGTMTEPIDVCELFLERVERLEQAARRIATGPADVGALRTLADRGLSHAERARLRALVAAARDDDDAEPHPIDALRAWHAHWAGKVRQALEANRRPDEAGEG